MTKRLTKIMIILINISIILYIISIKETKIISDINAFDAFGLFHYYNLYYYIAFILLLLSTIISIQYNKIYVFMVNIILLSIYIWWTPTLIESMPRMWDTWKVGYILEHILSASHIDYALSNNPRFLYIEYPNIFLFSILFIKILNIDIISYLYIYPLIFVPLIFISVYILFNLILKGKYSMIATLIFLLINTALYSHFCPQTFGEILIPIILFLIIHIVEYNNKINIIIILLIFMICIAMSHPTSCLIIIFFLLSYLILDHIYNIINKIKLTLSISRLFILFIIIFSSYLFFISINFSNSIVLTTYSHLNYITMEETNQNILGFKTYSICQPLRIYSFYIGYIASLILSSFLFIRKRREGILLLSFLGTSLLFFLFIFNITKGSFGDRVALISYFAIAISISIMALEYGSKYFKEICIIVIIVLLSLIPFSTIYYTEGISQYSYSYYNNANFVAIQNEKYVIDIDEGLIIPFYITNTENISFYNNKLVKYRDILSNSSSSIDDVDIYTFSERIKIHSLREGYYEKYMDLSIRIQTNDYYVRFYSSNSCQSYANINDYEKL